MPVSEHGLKEKARLQYIFGLQQRALGLKVEVFYQENSVSDQKTPKTRYSSTVQWCLGLQQEEEHAIVNQAGPASRECNTITWTPVFWYFLHLYHQKVSPFSWMLYWPPEHVFSPTALYPTRAQMAQISWSRTRGATDGLQQPRLPALCSHAALRGRLRARKKMHHKLDPSCSLLARATLTKPQLILVAKEKVEQLLLYNGVTARTCSVLLITEVIIIRTDAPFAWFFFYSFLLLFTSFVDLAGMYRSIVWMPCGEKDSVLSTTGGRGHTACQSSSSQLLKVQL